MKIDSNFENLLQGDWLSRRQAAIRRAIKTGLLRAGDAVKEEWQAVYSPQGPQVPGVAPLHWFTIEQKGHSIPLFETGDMGRALRTKVIGAVNPSVVVGIPAGSTQALKGAVHEFGATIPVTERMRNYLAWRGLVLRPSTRFIQIPARPVRPEVLRRATPKVEAIIAETLRKVTDLRRGR